MAKKACHSELVSETNKGGESLPLARTSSLATPSSGGHPRNAPVDTLIEAPYVLPEGWEWCKQNEVCRLTDGEKKTDVSYPYLEVKYLRGNKEKDFVTSGKFIKAGTKVILVDGENSGEVFTVPEDGYMGSTFKALSIQNVDEKYLQFFIQTKKDLYRNNKKGSAIPHLNKDLFFNMPFPLPPTLTEQQRIVNRIETMFAKLDQAQEKAQAVLDSFETRKAAILHKAFTGELTANWRKENGVSDDSWEEKRLEDECDFITKGTTPKKEDMSIGTGDIPYIKVYNLCFDTNLDFSIDPTFVKLESHKNFLARSITLPGDVLMNIVGPPFGKVSIVPDTYPEWNINQAIARFRCKPELYNVYLANYLISPKTIENMSRQIKTTAGQQNLTLEICRNITIPVPRFPEQQEIVRILDTVLEKESRAKEAAQTVLDQIALLKKSILARAFRGEL